MLSFTRRSAFPRLLATVVAGSVALLAIGPSTAQATPVPSVKPIPRKPPADLGPSAPTNLGAAQLPTISCERVVGLRFGCSTGTVPIAKYFVLRDASVVMNVGAATACPSGPGTEGSINAGSLPSDGTYTFALYVEDSKGRKSAPSANVSVTIQTEGTSCSYPGKPTAPAFCVSGKCELEKP